MRQTIIVAAVAALVTVVVNVVALTQFGADTVRSASVGDTTVSGNPSSEDGQIQGDTDCDGDVDAVDGLGVLVAVVALQALTQQEPCTDVGSLIPLGEGGPGPAGPAGPQGEQGPAGPQGAAGIIEFAHVTNDATVEYGTALSADQDQFGQYLVTFGRDVTSCVPAAVQGTSSGGTIYTNARLRQATVGDGGGQQANQVRVSFSDVTTEALISTDFHLIVVC